jgi:hypothetical protein
MDEVEKTSREGFHVAIEIAPIGEKIKEEFKSEIALLTPHCLKFVFSGSCNVDPGKFMSAVFFDNTIDEVHQ